MPEPLIEVSDADLADLRSRLENTRWTPDWPVDSWQAGMDAATLRRLVDHWSTAYDWRAQERRINALPAFDADLDGVAVRYLRFDAHGEPGIPLILTNGWPSTMLELVELAKRLSNPQRYGVDAAATHTVIVPAIPGLPFSPQRPTLGEPTHELWHRLMAGELGFARYGAHGGDLGSGITSRLGQQHPEAVAGIHLLAVANSTEVDRATATDAEREFLEAEDRWHAEEGAYQHQQATRPLSLAPGLADSPVGLLAWIVEKYRAWSDCGGDVSSRFTDDFLVTQASLYWFTNSIGTSFRAYYEAGNGYTMPVTEVSVPTAIAVFPHDLARPPREWVERCYAVERYTAMPRGGHFAPHEEPQLLAADIAAFFAGCS
ncbi:epoxide hydrolase family protein [Marisediminicola senii]|uniref:epoxide hydrolase family protein n=1 Tax=Marisediminicola senii TaxID=2711233 RepID=UPI001913ED4E|nr:epoxide hydrolase family protein [Marisediminicola senii]